MLRIDDDAVLVIDWAPVPSLRRTKHKTLHGVHEYATVARIPDRGSHLNPCHTPVRPNPEPDLVLPLFFGRRARGDIWYQERRGPEDITRAPTRARTRIRAGPGPAARPGAPARPRSLSRPTRRSIARPHNRSGRGHHDEGGGGPVGTVTAGACGAATASACDAGGVGSANQLTAGRPPPPPPPRGPAPPPPPPSNSAAPRQNTSRAIATCTANDRAAADPSRRCGSGSA